MGEITTSPAQYGDSNHTLLLKIATHYFGQLEDAGDIQAPAYSDSENMLLLKIAQSLELLA